MTSDTRNDDKRGRRVTVLQQFESRLKNSSTNTSISLGNTHYVEEKRATNTSTSLGNTHYVEEKPATNTSTSLGNTNYIEEKPAVTESVRSRIPVITKSNSFDKNCDSIILKATNDGSTKSEINKLSQPEAESKPKPFKAKPAPIIMKNDVNSEETETNASKISGESKHEPRPPVSPRLHSLIRRTSVKRKRTTSDTIIPSAKSVPNDMAAASGDILNVNENLVKENSKLTEERGRSRRNQQTDVASRRCASVDTIVRKQGTNAADVIKDKPPIPQSPHGVRSLSSERQSVSPFRNAVLDRSKLPHDKIASTPSRNSSEDKSVNSQQNMLLPASTSVSPHTECEVENTSSNKASRGRHARFIKYYIVIKIYNMHV